MIDYKYGVSLGAISPEHLEMMREWRNNPKIWAWCRQNDLITPYDQQVWFRSISEDPRIKMYIINRVEVYRDGQNYEPIGVCGLTDINKDHRRAEFSLYIAEKYQKCGYGKKTLKTLFQHGFYNLGLKTIWGETFDGNHVAAMFEKLGMLREGTRKNFYFKDGRFIDAHLYSIDREGWDFCHGDS